MTAQLGFVRWLGPALLAPPGALSAQPSTWIQPTIGIVQIFVGFVQAVILWQLTYLIFRRNSELKIAERHAAWFHKVVVDPQVADLRRFFRKAGQRFTEAALACASTKGFSTDLVMWDTLATAAIGDFNSIMLPTRRTLIDAVLGFDSVAAAELGNIMSELQETVSN